MTKLMVIGLLWLAACASPRVPVVADRCEPDYCNVGKAPR